MEKYITGIIQNHRHKLLAIGSVPDHIHILIGYNVNHLIPDLVEEIKTSSNLWVRERRLSKNRFEWQKGYGAFTFARRDLNNIIRYVISQEEHHMTRSFRNEYINMLNEFNIDYRDEYVFDFFD